MKLVISVDVEEEGLFSGQYPRQPPGVTNVEQLRRLEFVAREFRIPLTLLATYSVARDPAAAEILRRWRDVYGAEIGAHLHPWSTPPFASPAAVEPVPADQMPIPLVQAKLDTLRQTVREAFRTDPVAFRMGRFDLGRHVVRLLPACGFRTDSSIVPLRRVRGGPDHFLEPSDPFPLTDESGAALLREVPLTMVAWWQRGPVFWNRCAALLPGRLREGWLACFRYGGAVGIHPSWFSLPAMQWAARLHGERQGRVLNLFLHSSELQPGASPRFPTEAAVGRLVGRLRGFLAWLTRTTAVEGVTLSKAAD